MATLNIDEDDSQWYTRRYEERIAKMCAVCRDWEENGDGSQMVCEVCSWQNKDVADPRLQAVSKTTPDQAPILPNEKINWAPRREASNNKKRRYEAEPRKIVFPDDNDDGGDDDGDDNTPSIIIPWRDVPQHIWLMVNDVTLKPTVKGVTPVLSLQKRDSGNAVVWSTSTMAKSILTKFQCSKDANKTLFIKSMGLKASSLTNYQYYDYKLKVL